MLLSQGTIAHAPGWSALLDPAFYGFAIVMALAIGLALYLAIRPIDDADGDDAASATEPGTRAR